MSRVRRRRRGRGDTSSTTATARASSEVEQEVRRTILARYARLRRSEIDNRLVPAFCNPAAGEPVGPRQTRRSGNNGKPVFDTEAAAAAAAAELNRLPSSRAAVRPYPCPRRADGGRPHYHLTSQQPGAPAHHREDCPMPRSCNDDEQQHAPRGVPEPQFVVAVRWRDADGGLYVDRIQFGALAGFEDDVRRDGGTIIARVPDPSPVRLRLHEDGRWAVRDAPGTALPWTVGGRSAGAPAMSDDEIGGSGWREALVLDLPSTFALSPVVWGVRWKADDAARRPVRGPLPEAEARATAAEWPGGVLVAKLRFDTEWFDVGAPDEMLVVHPQGDGSGGR